MVSNTGGDMEVLARVTLSKSHCVPDEESETAKSPDMESAAETVIGAHAPRAIEPTDWLLLTSRVLPDRRDAVHTVLGSLEPSALFPC